LFIFDLRYFFAASDILCAIAANSALAAEAAQPKTGVTYTSVDNVSAYRASLQDVLGATNNPEYAFIDVRTQAEWDAGRVPGAMQFLYPSDIVNADGTFKTVEEYKELFKNVPPDAKIITYCRAGIRSSSSHFIFKDILGWPNQVLVYEGSWNNYSWAGAPYETDLRPISIHIKSVTVGNNQADINYDTKSVNGEGYAVYVLNDTGKFEAYSNVDYDSKGAHIKGLTNGKKYYAYIQYNDGNGGISQSYAVNFQIIPPTSITMSAAQTSLNMKVGAKLQLRITVSPDNADPSVTWSSSNPAVATVDPVTGQVTALKTGSVRITVKSNIDPAVSYMFLVMINT